jgi:hypothetical protein
MLPDVRRLAAVALLSGALVIRVAVPVGATGEPAEQTVVPITPSVEQRVEPIAPPAEQHVEQLDGDGVQHVSGEQKTVFRRSAEGAAKVVVGVVAAGVSIGAMVASLLFL